MDSVRLLYKISLIVGAVANLLMAASLWANKKKYKPYIIYSWARQFMELWLAAFALGYLIHAFVDLRGFWPTAAGALTVSYFHLGAICFCWGFIPLLNPMYLTQKIAIRDTVILGVGLVCYWTAAIIWKQTCIFSIIPYLIFFAYCGYCAVVFYKTFQRVTLRLLTMSYGNVSGFVRWMQASCDVIVFFGIFIVAVVISFPNSIRYFTPITIIMGIGIFAFIVYSLSKYGKVVKDATRATKTVAREYYSPFKGKENTNRAPNL
ncbi:MAG: hypothetical protein J5769_02715 [Bacteroidales bacterium]|nr:hypothetical protein [Bacteroidales bacterium]